MWQLRENSNEFWLCGIVLVKHWVGTIINAILDKDYRLFADKMSGEEGSKVPSCAGDYEENYG